MAPRRTKGARRGKGGRRGKRISAGARALMRKNNVAKVSQLIETVASNANQIYEYANISLAAFDRATVVARGYQFYRISKVKMVFKPRYDTWGAQLACGSVPYLYYLLDKGYNANSNNMSSFNALRDTGAVSRRFDDKSISVTWTPTVAIGVGDIQGNTNSQQYSLIRKAPWMNTNANSANATQPWKASGIDHRGIVFGVEQDVIQGGGAQYQYDVTLEAHFEFKDPLPSIGSNTVTYTVVDLENPLNIKQ